MKPSILSSIVLLIFLFQRNSQAQVKPGSREYDSLKRAGMIIQPGPSAKPGNYPLLRDAREIEKDRGSVSRVAPLAGQSSATASSATAACSVENPANDPLFQVLPANDDGSSVAIPLQFTFNFFGTNYNQLYVNTNGNITFDAPNGTYSSTGFPSSFDMIAPFWADVDTRGPGSGRVFYKSEPTRFTVTWYRVGYYELQANKLNTFKLVITNGADPIIGVGNSVAFFYDDMQWTAGDASGGVNGLEGVPATVGVNNGQGVGACFFYQIGRFGKAGTEYVDPRRTSGVDYLDNRCFFFDVSTIENVTMDFDFNEYLCAVKFRPRINNPQNCDILFYEWDLGDGNLSYEMEPLHSYNAPGDYTVTLNIFYNCGACAVNSLTAQKLVTVRSTEDILVDSLIRVTTDNRPGILSVSTATFSDAWPLQHDVPALNEVHGFLNGSQGVWRREGEYVYDVPRVQSSPADISSDGTFSMNHFNWQYADIGAIPGWIKTNTMTAYSPYSYEVENQNVLGVHNAALYDYGGHLVSANGYNMKYREMAFTSFEYLSNDRSSGNWVFGTQPLPQYYEYETFLNFSHVVVVKAPADRFNNVTSVDVTAWSFFGFRRRTIRDNGILCVRDHPTRPGWSILVLAREPYPGIWGGKVRVNNEVNPTVLPDLDGTIAHSGSTSLKITTEKSFEQPLLQLDSGRSYLLSAWVSVNDPHVIQPKLADNLGIEVTLRDDQGLNAANFSLAPSGVVIEGWQRVEGTFICPVPNAQVVLKFKPGTRGTAWYDDLRLHPKDGNMRSYVYDLQDYRLQATLDEENFGSFFYYDEEGSLYLTKKETIDGVKTLQENVSYQVER